MRSVKDLRLTTLEDAFKAFADPTRLRILGLLAGGEICVCHIHECLGIPQPTASRHLAYLRKKGLVRTRKEGLWVHYALAPLEEPALRVLMSAVTHVLCHCDAITRDRQRLETQTGCCAPSRSTERFACCAPDAAPGAKSRKVRRTMS
ncbi:MAG TPA: metalloregulator ArsR/SmtB family transcription factor [Vicinamibacterales bacterium]|nr:metalloregulator ArsR/SmtB family transcription factor [Vicinamibacterales bacterium]